MNLSQVYTGGCYYLYGAESGPHRLLVGLSCQVGDEETHQIALLDTASTWCLLPPRVSRALGFELERGESPVRLHSRFGTFTGRLERIPLRLPATVGAPLEVDATWFVCPDWPGPLVIGWQGCLERFRFGIDPAEDVFYFAGL